jgi:hypothetical protein
MIWRLVSIALLVAPLAVPHVVQAQEIGAFFTQVNAYTYTSGPKQGRRILARPRQAFSVLNLTTDADERLWLYVVHPNSTAKQTGSGWTPLTPSELLNMGENKVDIFADASEDGSVAKIIARVPGSDVELLNVTRTSKRFSQVVWQKVRFASTVPVRAWVQGVAGIFRPGKSSEFLNRVYVEMVSRNLKKNKLERLLSGVVRVGDSKWDVERALGAPLRMQKDQASGNGQVTWQFPAMTVRFDGDVVNQIN